MATVNVNDRRIETYLTNFARSYKLGQNLADFIAPPFKVSKSSDKYLVWTKHNFRIYDNKISGNEKAKEIDLKVDEATYACEEYSLATSIQERSLKNMEGVGTIRLQEDKIKHLKNSQMLAREKRVWDIAGSTSIVTNNSDLSAAWSTQSSGTPVKNIIDAMITIESNCGMIPNAIAMTYEVAMTIIETDEWKDYFKYTIDGNRTGLWSAIDGLRNLGLEPQISGARGLSNYEGSASDPTWERMFDEKVLIFYREANPTPESMTFMYSPYMEKDLIESYRVNGERRTRYEIYEDIDELLVNEACAYLYTNVVS